MKKLSAAQFARLTELLAKGSTLTEEEQAEKASLESLIVAEDETPADGGEGEGEGESGGGGDEETGDGGEKDDEAADPKAFERLTLGGKLKALVASRAALSAKLAAATGQVAALNESLAATAQRAETAEASLATAQASLTEAQARVATLEAEARALHTAVTDELAGLGVDRSELVASDAEGKGGPVESAYDDFRAAKTPEERAAAHRRLKAVQAKAKGETARSN